MDQRVWTRHDIVLLFTSSAVALLLSACAPGLNGEFGNLRFRDTTPHLSEMPHDQLAPLPVGARIRLEVSETSGADKPTIVSAVADDPTIVSIDGSTTGLIVLRGTSAGTTAVTVTTDDHVTDVIPVEVVEPAIAEIHILPWAQPLELPERLWNNGVAIVPGSPVDLFVEYRTSDNTLMTGFGSNVWEITPGSGATLDPKEQSDFATLRAGETAESLVVSVGGRGEATMSFEGVDLEKVTTLMIYDQTDDSGPAIGATPLPIEVGRQHVLHLAAYTDEGSYVIGSGQNPLEVEATPESEGIVSVVATASSTAGDSADLSRMLQNGRAFILSAETEGMATLKVDWAGRTTEFEIEVIPAR